MEFISGCFERLELISGGLIQYKPDEIFQEPAQIQSSYKSEVHLYGICPKKTCTKSRVATEYSFAESITCIRTFHTRTAVEDRQRYKHAKRKTTHWF